MCTLTFTCNWRCISAAPHELAEKLRAKMLSAEALKQFVSHVRCAAYPDVDAHRRSRAQVEKAWPAYADDRSLSRVPQFFWNSSEASGTEWLRQHNNRLQHALSHMNHHTHPLINHEDDPATGERRPLQSCRAKAQKAKKSDVQF